MSRRAQGTLEYVLLLGAVLAFVVLALVVFTSTVLSPVNRQVAGSSSTYVALTAGCLAASHFVIDPTGSGASLSLCVPVRPAGTVLYVYPSGNSSGSIGFDGSEDVPTNMTFFDDNRAVYLNFRAKTGQNLDVLLDYCVDVYVDDAALVTRLCAVVGTPEVPPVIPPSAPPAITSVSVYATSANATVGWQTDTQATSQVDYGRYSGAYSGTAGDPSNLTVHTLLLSPLSPNTTYFYRITSCNVIGCNSSIERSFTTAAYAPGLTYFNATDYSVSLGLSAAVSLASNENGSGTDPYVAQGSWFLLPAYSFNSSGLADPGAALTANDNGTGLEGYFALGYPFVLSSYNLSSSPAPPDNATLGG